MRSRNVPTQIEFHDISAKPANLNVAVGFQGKTEQEKEHR